MKTNNLFIVITLLLSQVSLCQTTISGKIDNYTGNTSNILINPLFPENIGEINEKGVFNATFGETYFKKIKKTMEESQKKETGHMSFSTLADFQTRFQCEGDSFTFTNSEQAYLQLLGAIGFIVGDLKSNKVAGIVRVANSKEFSKSQIFNPQNDPTIGYMLDWYYVEKAAKVNGDCTKRMSTGKGDKTYDRNIKVDLDLQPGWNLVKYEINKVFTAQNGKEFSQSINYSSLDNMPGDMKFVYLKK